MRKERQTLKVSSLLLNDGRLGWLPANPRQWTAADVERIANSIQTDPDFLEDRPVLVVPCDKKYIVFGGNMRREGSDKVGLKEIPAVIYYPETDADRDTIKRRAILDNGSFGAWDFDALANEWDDLPLTDWGVPVIDTDRDEGITDEVYTKKIEIPTYTPNTEFGKPRIDELFDKSKYETLCKKIKDAELPPDVEFFLLLAASRHIVFNYERIGDYYAEADKKVQRLMEDSALVIIDWKEAIDKGFVKLTKTLDKLYANEQEGE